MRVRNYNKDHLKGLATPLAAISNSLLTIEGQRNDELSFWTLHPERPVLVDVNVFKEGQQQNPLGTGGTWSGPFSGRPHLIGELMPALKAALEYAAPKTVTQTIHAIRSWWRLFDAVEQHDSAGLAPTIRKVCSVADINELHRQVAIDINMGKGCFAQFIRLVNLVRTANRLPRLYWDAPEGGDPKRHLPPQWQIKEIRFALKHAWFDAVARWATAARLLSDRNPENEAEVDLLRNYERFGETVERTGLARPSAQDAWNGLAHHQFNRRGFNYPKMLRGFYPDSLDIRIAFHLCLVNTGWNPCVLLNLNANDRIVEPHPKDPKRYIISGFKERGKSTQITHGLFKSKGAAGSIILTLIERTAPLRVELRRRLEVLREDYSQCLIQGSSEEELDLKRKKIVKYEQGERSPWLYVSSKSEGIQWLDDRNYFRAIGRERDDCNGFIAELVLKLNEKRPPDKHLEPIKSSDFRDAFAAFHYQDSGGMVMYVMRALGHKSPDTTQNYLNNTLLNEESGRLYRTFSNALWNEVKVYGRVDPTILAKWSRDGEVSDEERRRLDEYRGLHRSRIGVGCKDPTHPPKAIAPRFKVDGKSMCPVQRCTLCLEHAVIFPDSLPGLCKRLAELRFIQRRMSGAAFIESAFGEEIQNTEWALRHFDSNEAERNIKEWERRIEDGTHRVYDFDGVQEVR